jgi:NAD(P)-dependent dehydrogenase (short-subunit alcohol dehydrogenase family)
MPGLRRLLGEPALSDIEREVAIAPATRPDETRPDETGTGSGKSVLVTGSSSGIGLASVVALSNRGWKVFASMRDVSRADRLELALGDRATSVRVVQLDVTDKASITEAMKEVSQTTGGHLDALVHNAGTPGAGFFVDGGPELLRETMETNFFGPAQLTAEALPALSAAKGRMVVVSSIAAFVTPPGLSAYAASKWALEGWCSSLAVELVPLGVDIALVEPGTVKTPIWQHQLEQSTDDRYRAWAADLEKRTATGVRRFGRDPFKVGEAIAEVVAAPHPHFRNPVGADSWTMWAVSKVVPASWRNRGLSLITHAPRPAPSGG